MTDNELAFRKKFGEQLSEELEKRGMTKVALARRLGVAAPNVSQWCSGRRVPNLYRWWQIQRVLKEAG